MSEPKDITTTAAPQTAITPAIASAALPRAAPHRGGLTERPSTATTEEELDTIERAIDHPPSKADHFGTAVSVLGAVVLVLKTIGPSMGNKDWALVIAAIALGSMQVFRYVTALFAKTPNKDAAKLYITRLRVQQGWTPPPETNWKKLKRMIWERAFQCVSRKKNP